VEDTVSTPKLLLVDDEAGMREGCRRVLAPQGYQVDTAADVASALRSIRQTDYDLVLVDVMMPDGNGIDLIQPIHDRDPDTTCIVITGYATVEMAVEAVRQGAYDFLSKPFTSDQLIFAVNQGLERRHLRLETQELDTCRRRAAELAQAKTEIEKLEQVKSQFMLTVAHELRAPVAAIQSYLNLVLAGYVSEEELRPTLSRAQIRLQELLDLIADLLELARLKQFRDLAPAEASPQPVADILEQVRDLLREQAQQKNQLFQVEILNHPTIVASPNHLRQIWMNLISNAIKYTPQGGRVMVSLRADKDGLTGTVEDTGIGIAENDLPNLFQEFFRTNEAKASGEIGTGLGLAIVKQIVESYQGAIKVESKPGQGTRFTFTLPFEPARLEPGLQPAAALAAAQTTPQKRPAPTGTHARVLSLADTPAPGRESPEGSPPSEGKELHEHNP
jgi:signal transduction histidine kinase